MKKITHQALVKEILRCEVGSTAHGVSQPSSGDDLDMLGVGIEKPEHVFGLNHFEQFVYRTAEIRDGKNARSLPGDIDLTIYSLRRFLQLAAKGNPTILMLLHAPIMEATDEGSVLRSYSSLFVTKSAGAQFLGYMQAQRRRLEAGKGSTHGKREYLIQKYGFDTKFAMHMLRLGVQGHEFITTGRMNVPMNDHWREYLLKVREGLVPEETCVKESIFLERLLTDAIERSKLPKTVNYKAVASLSQRIYLKVWREAGLIL